MITSDDFVVFWDSFQRWKGVRGLPKEAPSFVFGDGRMKSIEELRWWFQEGSPSLTSRAIDYVKLSAQRGCFDVPIPFAAASTIKKSKPILAALRQCSREHQFILEQAYAVPISEAWLSESCGGYYTSVYRPDVVLLMRMSTSGIDKEVEVLRLKGNRRQARELEKEKQQLAQQVVALLADAQREFVRLLREIRAIAKAQVKQDKVEQRRLGRRTLKALRNRELDSTVAVLRSIGVGQSHVAPSSWVAELGKK